MKLSIRWALVLVCIVLVWGTHLIITPSSYLSSQRILQQHARDIMVNISDFTMEQAQNHLSQAKKATALTKRLLSEGVLGADLARIDRLELYFHNQLVSSPHFAGMYFAKSNGDFFYVSRNSSHMQASFRTKIIQHDSSGRKTHLVWRNPEFEEVGRDLVQDDTYDPRTRPWYKQALQGKKIVCTDPYIFFTSQKPGITIAGPVYDQSGSLKGVVGVDIGLDNLSQFISKLRVGKSGRAFMLNKNSDVVAFPDLEKLKYSGDGASGKVRLPKISEIDDVLCQKAFASIGEQVVVNGVLSMKEPAFTTFGHNTKSYNAMFSPLSSGEWPWIIGVYVPEDNYLGEIKEYRNDTIRNTIILSILATVFGLFISKSISRPISQLKVDAQAIEKNDMQSDTNVHSVFMEIEEVGKSFKRMKGALVSYKAELLQKESIYRAMTSTVNDAIVMIDESGKITYWNPAAETMFGYSQHEVLGLDLHDILAPAKYLEAWHKGFSAFQETGEGKALGKSVEVESVQKNGNQIFLELSLSSLQVNGKWHAVGVARNITSRKEEEREKVKILGQLEQARKMEALGTLAGGIAHDFNNILAAILGFTDLAKDQLQDGSVVKSDLDLVTKAGERAKDLVQQILAFSRRGDLDLTPLNVKLIIKEALGMMRATLPENIEVRTEIAPDCGAILADSTQIHQALVNLCINAQHAMQGSGGVLSISLQNIDVEHIESNDDSGPIPGQYVEMKVKDTGQGMEQYVLEKVFDPYFTTKEVGKGTGLGLAVVHGVVKKHGGYIRAESSLGNGACFRILLPRVEYEVQDDDGGKEAQRLPVGSERIMFVDDEELIGAVGKRRLEKLGYTVELFTSSPLAVQAFEQQPDNYDVLVTDMSMPEMNGIDFVKKIFAIKPDLPVVLCSGYSDLVDEEKVLAMGIGHFFYKPYSEADMAKVIRRLLDQKV